MSSNIKKTTLKNGKVRWQARVKIKGVGYLKTFDRKTDAEEWKRQIESGKLAKRTMNYDLLITTIDEILDWVETEIDNSVLPKSSRHNFPRLRSLIGHAQIAQLNQESLNNFVTALKRSTTKTGNPIAKDTFRRAYYALKRSLEIWADHNSFTLMCEFNHKLPASWSHVKSRRISDEESLQLKNAVAKAIKVRRELWPLAMDFLMCTGLRLQEFHRAEFSDISKKGVLTVWARNSKTGTDRHIQLTEDALEIIKELPRTQERLFPFPSKASIENQFALIRKEAKLMDISLHTFRHEYTSRLVEETNLSHPQIMALTGHKNLRTYQRYYNLNPDKVAPELSNIRLARKTDLSIL